MNDLLEHCLFVCLHLLKTDLVLVENQEDCLVRKIESRHGLETVLVLINSMNINVNLNERID